jgi:hypothetical protein
MITLWKIRMAKPNYSYEKRQKEIAKKKKKEEKRLKKSAVEEIQPKDVEATSENVDTETSIDQD